MVNECPAKLLVLTVSPQARVFVVVLGVKQPRCQRKGQRGGLNPKLLPPCPALRPLSACVIPGGAAEIFPAQPLAGFYCEIKIVAYSAINVRINLLCL